MLLKPHSNHLLKKRIVKPEEKTGWFCPFQMYTFCSHLGEQGDISASVAQIQATNKEKGAFFTGEVTPSISYLKSGYRNSFTGSKDGPEGRKEKGYMFFLGRGQIALYRERSLAHHLFA